MPEYNFNDPIDNQEPIVNNVDDVTPVQPINPVESVQQFNNQPKQQRANPQIPNDEVPIVVLVGPPESGKSMITKRLCDYLRSSKETEYTVKANTTLFGDAEYLSDCEYFDGIIGQKNLAMPNTVNYLLVDVSDSSGGNDLVRILEAPGEHFFSLEHPENEPNKHSFEGYMDTIRSAKRKVIYIIILDLDSPSSFRRNRDLRNKYEEKMINLYKDYVRLYPAKVILLYNKVDLAHGGDWANRAGVINKKAVFDDAKGYYSKLFSFFTRKFLFWKIPNYMFVPFCTGSYKDGYVPSEDPYPVELWKAITKIW